MPGPGNYDVSASGSIPTKGNKFYMGSRLNDPAEKERSRVPGPGSFDPYLEAVRSKAPGYSMAPLVSRPKSEVEKNPGPGSYESPAPRIKGADFKSTGQRYIPGLDKQKNMTPGPGSYQDATMTANVATYQRR